MILAILAMLVGMWIIVSSSSDVMDTMRVEEEDVVETAVVVQHHHADDYDDGLVVSTTTSSSGSSSSLIGFHDPSYENMYGSNYYFKPKGIGYPLVPTGGVHPIYMIDNHHPTDTTTTTTTTTNNTAILLPPNDFDNYELSPYTDVRLQMTSEERTSEQTYWENKLQSIRKDYGYWNFRDDYPAKHDGKSRPVVDWSSIATHHAEQLKEDGDSNNNPLLHGEISKEDFPKDAWQTDNTYITSFITEAKSLLHRVREGIYDEYGWSSSSLTDEQLSQRNVWLGVHIASEITSTGPDVGVAWMYQNSFDALVKKLLNAMMTNDHFFVTLGGHSAAAGHGNNFFQSYMMQFQEVMEPVFDRLGMVLVSANRAQGGMGTLQAVLAGVDVYGEKDFMVWDSSMTEKGPLQDVFGRMMLLSGHRVPILFDIGGGRGFMDVLRKEVGAHVGGITSGNPHLKETESLEQAATLPHAVQHLFCKSGVPTCGQTQYKYNATCWTDRVDVETPPTAQNKGYGGQAKWHPGNRSHQLIARRMTLLFLRALDEALDLWLKATY